MGCILMVQTMSGYESDRDWLAAGRRRVLQNRNWRRRKAEWCLYFEARDLLEMWKVLDACSPDDSDVNGFYED